jgi:membrane peptidoglycan carboxypeptidase
MKDALVSVEDRRFREHWGVDPVGIIRSVMVRAQSGRWRQGGSTITQQLARNIFLNNSRTFDRKIREAILSLALESKFSKDQILELYLNKVYFGGGAYGVDPPRASSSAIRASSFRWARRRSSPAWSRRLRTIRPRPMPRPPWTAPRWCWKPWSMPAR